MLISRIGVLPSGSFMFYYLLDAQSFILSWHVPHREHSNSDFYSNRATYQARNEYWDVANSLYVCVCVYIVHIKQTHYIYIYIYKVKVKVKFTLEQATKA